MPTILELFENFEGKREVADKKETLFEQETTGIRVDSAVELNNPVLYGNEAIRIANRSTPLVERMKDSQSGEAPERGLIDRGISGISGGRVTGLRDLRDTVNSKLGIPTTTIPTDVVGDRTFKLSYPYQSQTVISVIMNDGEGSLLGQTLKESGGGNPKTIGKQVAGTAIGKLKDELRSQLFTDLPSSNPPQVQVDNNDNWYDNDQNKYSNVVKIGSEYDSVETRFTSEITVNPPDEDRTNLSPITLEDLSPTYGATKLSSVNSKSSPPTDGDGNEYESQFITEGDKYTDTVSRPDSEDGVKERFKREPIDGTVNKGSTDPASKTGEITLDDLSPLFGRDTIDRPSGDPSDIKSEFLPNNSYVDGGWNGKKTLVDRGFGSSYTTKAENSKTFDQLDNTAVDGNYSVDGVDYNLIPFWISDLDGSQGVAFSAYLTGISDTISPEWGSKKFVGNPYPYYVYSGVERTVTFTLSIFPHSSAGLKNNWEKISYFTKKTYPTIDAEGQFTNPNFIRFRIGDMYNNRIAFIESWTVNIDENSPWEIEQNGLLLPHYITLEASLKLVETAGSEEQVFDHN